MIEIYICSNHNLVEVGFLSYPNMKATDCGKMILNILFQTIDSNLPWMDQGELAILLAPPDAQTEYFLKIEVYS